jgi:uncharacterized iron-regulated protein
VKKSGAGTRTRASAHARLTELQRKIHRGLEREAARYFGPVPAAIRRYEAECQVDFDRRHTISTKSELVAAIRENDVSFVADYHAYGQAQRTALRLLREAVLPGERWVLGLELIPSQFQQALDDFQAGLISVERFHAIIRYREEWGFPWKNYEPLFAWARKRGVRLLALNRPKELIYYKHWQNAARATSANGKTPEVPAEKSGSQRTIRDLHARDQWAAGLITDCFHDYRLAAGASNASPLRMVVLFGGYHVGRVHLPEQLNRISAEFLGKKLKSVSVHQNVDSLYWRLASREHEMHAQVLRFARDVFCVFSGTPWSQLQSLISTTEGEGFGTSGAGGVDGDESRDDHPTDDGDGDSSPDYLSMMSKYGSVITEFFGLAPVSFDSLTAHTLAEADFVDSLRDAYTPAETRLIRGLVSSDQRLYLARAQVTYLTSASHNGAAELAAIHLHRSRTRLTSLYEGGREEFFRLALESAFGFLGSLTINPRRKCDLAGDHRQRLKSLGFGATPTRGIRAAFAGEAAARRFALATLHPGHSSGLQDLPTREGFKTNDGVAAWVGARYAGQMLAAAIHPIVLKSEHRSTEFKRILALLMSRGDFEAAFRELQGRVEPKRLLKPSKRDAI